MNYKVLTGNEEFARATQKEAARHGSRAIPVEFNPAVDDMSLGIYDGDDLVRGPYPISPTWGAEIRKVMDGLGWTPSQTPPPPPPADPPPKKQAVSPPADPPALVPVPVEPPQTLATPAHSSSLDVLTAEIRTLNDFTKTSILQVGLRLKKAKALVSHGGWLTYVREQLEFTPRWAQFCMKAADLFGSNAKLTSHFDSAKFYMLMEADEEDRPALAEQMGGLDQEQFAKAVEDAKTARLQAEEERQKRAAAEAQLVQATRQVEAAEKRATAAQAQVKALESRPTPVPEVKTETKIEKVEVPVDNPALLAEITHLKAVAEQKDAALQTEQREHAKLLQAVGGLEKVRKEKAEVDLQKQHLQARIHRLGVQFDDEGRDFYGGSKLDDSVQTLLQPLADAIGDAKIIKRVGAGGTCQEETVKTATGQLRELADLWDQIMQDRAKRWVVPTIKEVE